MALSLTGQNQRRPVLARPSSIVRREQRQFRVGITSFDQRRQVIERTMYIAHSRRTPREMNETRTRRWIDLTGQVNNRTFLVLPSYSNVKYFRKSRPKIIAIGAISRAATNRSW